MSQPPKTFISYSWTTPEHEQWVLQLANQLVENGVDVILDKWLLREGEDKYVFMERMVTDPDVKKVVMICDKAYAEKADSRKGGVGTEAQIISGEIYAKVSENTKFVAIIKEKDQNGQPYTPAYLKSRIFIDMSDEEAEAANFEQLLRWIFDKPLYQKPELGKPPAYLFEENSISLGTTSKHRLALEALKNNKLNVVGAVRDYFETFAENLAQLKIEPEEGTNLDDKVIESINAFIPYREEVVEVLLAIPKYNAHPDVYREIHKFFELILPYASTIPAGKNSYLEGEQDNFRFIVREMFLYAVAGLVKYEKFNEIGDLLSQKLYSPQYAKSQGFQECSFDYTEFNTYLKTLDNRARRLQNNSVNLPHLFKERATRRDITFGDIQQTDFVLYLYSVLCVFRGKLNSHFVPS